MSKYETIFIINPNAESEGIERSIEDIQNLISDSGGEVTNVDRWGKKRLAYEVKGNRDGYYVLISFEAGPQFAQRLGRYYGLTEQIIKYMTVKAEELPESKREADEGEDEERISEGVEEDEDEE